MATKGAWVRALRWCRRERPVPNYVFWLLTLAVFLGAASWLIEVIHGY